MLVKRVGVIGSELGLAELERFLDKRQGQVELAGAMIAGRQVVHAAERVGVIGAELGLPA